jgi:hypothetical protein
MYFHPAAVPFLRVDTDDFADPELAIAVVN